MKDNGRFHIILKTRRLFLNFLLSGFVCLQLAGQITADLPLIEPSHLTTFTFEDGLPICNGHAFPAPDGRIYVTTCGTYQAEDNTYLFEFNGTQSRKIPFHQILGDKNAFPTFCGITDQGELYGVLNTTEGWGHQVFIFEPQKQQLKTFDLEKHLPPDGITWYVEHHRDYGYTIYGIGGQQFHFFGLQDGSLKKIGHIPAHIKWNLTAELGTRVSRQKEAIWLYENAAHPLIRYDLKTQTLRKYTISDFSDATLNWLGIGEIYSFNKGDVYIALRRDNQAHDLYKLNPAEDRFDLILQKGFEAKIPHYSTTGAHTLQSHDFDALGNIIIKNWDFNGGFHSAYLLETETGNIYNYSPVLRSVYQSLPKPRSVINFIYAEDFRKKLFISSWGGISIVTVKPFKAFQAYAIGASRATIPLPNNQFFVKTEGAPDALLDLEKQTSAPYLKENCLTQIRIPNLSDIVVDKEGKIFIPPADKEELIQYNPKNQACLTLSVGTYPYRSTFLDDTRLAIVNFNGELFYFDITTQKLQPALVQDSVLNFQADVFQIKLLSDGFLWVGASNGLWKVNRTTNEATQPHPELPFQNDQVYYINEGEDGLLWLGTGNGGLQIYNPKTGDLKIVDNSQGLSNNTVISILKDEGGIRWLNTYNGINLVSPSGEFLAKAYEEDGLAGNEGNRFSSLKTEEGKLIFGSINGVTVIDPEMAKQQLFLEDSLKIFLTELTYFDKKSGQDTVQTYDFIGPISLTLPAAQRFLKLRFALSDFQNIQENSYDYRLEAQGNQENADWIFLGSSSELTLTNLPAGRYDLVIRGKNYRGQRTQKPIRISLHIKEFFYNTIWFYALLFLFLSALPFFWLYKERYERGRLQELVQKRTAKIEEDKQIIEAQAEQLKSLDEAKSRFFANISHEFRTPLTIISGMMNQIKKHPDRWLEKGAKMIEKSNSNLLDLINQILDLQKLESGHLKADLKLGDILPFLRTIFDQFQAFAQSKQQQLVFTTTVNSLEMDYDAEKTLRIVSNLLSNAIKYTPDKGKISLAVSTMQTQEAQNLVLTITDSGIGIVPEKVSNIFDRFYQASTARQSTEIGTGIGLSLTLELVKLLNGEIKVSSEVDQGTTFTVLLPVTRNAKRGVASDPLTIASSILGKQGLPQKEVVDKKDLPIALVAEDNSDIAQYLQICLEGKYQVNLAVNGQEGIDKGLEIVPDIIVSDVMMPKKNGFELCEALKEDNKTSHIPIILLTAKSDVSSRIVGFKHGADDYLAKPFHEEELLVRMENLLSIRRKLQDRYRDLYGNPPAPEKEAPTYKEDAFILKLKEIFDKNMHDPRFTLDALSKAMNLSRSQLGRKIKSLTGISPAIFTRSLRLQKARQLLLEGELAVKEVAYDVGFSDPAYFSRAYSEEFGENPSSTRVS